MAKKKKSTKNQPKQGNTMSEEKKTEEGAATKEGESVVKAGTAVKEGIVAEDIVVTEDATKIENEESVTAETPTPTEEPVVEPAVGPAAEPVEPVVTEPRVTDEPVDPFTAYQAALDAHCELMKKSPKTKAIITEIKASYLVLCVTAYTNDDTKLIKGFIGMLQDNPNYAIDISAELASCKSPQPVVMGIINMLAIIHVIHTCMRRDKPVAFNRDLLEDISAKHIVKVLGNI